jgi:hypothetical protein
MVIAIAHQYGYNAYADSQISASSIMNKGGIEHGEKGEIAGKTKGSEVCKKRVQKSVKPKEQPEKLLAKVPEEHVFWCCDGRIFRDMKELAEGLAAMSDETYSYHRNAEKKDFTNWVMNVIGDTKLAEDLANVLDRNEAVSSVATRITILTRM